MAKRIHYLRGITHFYTCTVAWLTEQNDDSLTFRSLFVLFTLYAEGGKTGSQLDTALLYKARNYCKKFLDNGLIRMTRDNKSYARNCFVLSRSGEDLINRIFAFVESH